MIIGSRFFGLADGIRLRREHFGGILFDTNNGTMIDVDREAFTMLSIIQNNGVIKGEDILRYLYGAKIILNTNSGLLRVGV